MQISTILNLFTTKFFGIFLAGLGVGFVNAKLCFEYNILRVKIKKLNLTGPLVPQWDFKKFKIQIAII